MQIQTKYQGYEKVLMIINEKQQRRSLEIIEEVISPRSVSDVSDKSAGDQQDDRVLLGQNKQVIEIVQMVEEVREAAADE